MKKAFTILASVLSMAVADQRSVVQQVSDNAMIQIGSGPRKVVAILTPFCSHCRILLQHILKRATKNPNLCTVSIGFSVSQDVETQKFAFMTALVANKAPAKIQDFFSSVKKVSDLEDTKKLNKNLGINLTIDPQDFLQAQKHMNAAYALLKKENITSVPVVWYEQQGQWVRSLGYQETQLDEILGQETPH